MNVNLKTWILCACNLLLGLGLAVFWVFCCFFRGFSLQNYGFFGVFCYLCQVNNCVCLSSVDQSKKLVLGWGRLCGVYAWSLNNNNDVMFYYFIFYMEIKASLFYIPTPQ